jgi:hypothetical protein
MTADEVLGQGKTILHPVLDSAGFVPKTSAVSGDGSGGRFVEQRWTNGARSIVVWVRFGLGSVRYAWGDDVFDHRDVAEAIGARCSYPGFSEDPVDAFRHLADDLAGPMAALLDDRHEHVHQTMVTWVPSPRRLP